MMTTSSSKRRRTEEGTYHVPGFKTTLSRNEADRRGFSYFRDDDGDGDDEQPLQDLLLGLLECYSEPEPCPPLSSNLEGSLTSSCASASASSIDPFPCDFSSNVWKDCRDDCEPLSLFSPPHPPCNNSSSSSLNQEGEEPQEEDSLLVRSRQVVDPFENEREGLTRADDGDNDDDDGYETDTESDKDDFLEDSAAMTTTSSCDHPRSRSQRQEEWRSSQQEQHQRPETPEPDMSVLEVCMNDQDNWGGSHRLMDVLGLDREESSEKERYRINSNPQEENVAQLLRQLTLVSRLEWSLPLSVLSRAVQRASHLKSLSLFSIAMQGDKQDFEVFARALQQHSSLEELNIVDCCLVDPSIAIDSLLQALAVIPTLKTVKINAMDLERQASPNTGVRWMNPLALASLGSSKSITTLSLEDLDLSDAHIQEFAGALKGNATLQKLTLWDCNISDQGGQRMAEMLKVNRSIEKLDLSFNDFGDGALQTMGQALRVNRSLWSLSLHGSNPHPPKNSRSKRNRDSSKSKASNTSRSYDELLRVLREHNHVLREVILELVEDPRVDLYVMLNRNRHILQNETVTRCKLVDCLAEHAAEAAAEDSGEPENVLLFSRPPPTHPAQHINLSFSFCLLQANPELCDVNR